MKYVLVVILVHLGLVSMLPAATFGLDRATLYYCGPVNNGRVFWEQDVQMRLSNQKVVMEIAPRDTYNGKYWQTDSANTRRTYLDSGYRTGAASYLTVPNSLRLGSGRVSLLVIPLGGAPKTIVYECKAWAAEG